MAEPRAGGREHLYRLHLRWTGAGASGTTSYAGYGRDHVISASGKPDLDGSSDPAFRGDPARWSPEELLLASLSACHQLWYLHLCAKAGIVVLAYEDDPVGIMQEQPDGAGQFAGVTLHPVVTLARDIDCERAATLHEAAGRMCFIARSMRFNVRVAPVQPTKT
jgi:organic hydroperoxide reductase OsmC/OhrA